MARGPKAIAFHLSEDERAELERVPWVKSQWKLRAYPGQLCMEINILTELRQLWTSIS